MEIQQRYQPLNSSLCGQTCIAMIAGISLGDAIRRVGKVGGTTGPDLHKALYRIGIPSSESMVRLGKGKRLPRKSNYFKALPARCIVKVRAEGVKRSHWILIWDGKKYDPYPGRIPWEYISGYIEIKAAA